MTDIIDAPVEEIPTAQPVEPMDTIVVTGQRNDTVTDQRHINIGTGVDFVQPIFNIGPVTGSFATGLDIWDGASASGRISIAPDGGVGPIKSCTAEFSKSTGGVIDTTQSYGVSCEVKIGKSNLNIGATNYDGQTIPKVSIAQKF